MAVAFILFTFLSGKIQLSLIYFSEGCNSFLIEILKLHQIFLVAFVHLFDSLADVASLEGDVFVGFVEGEAVLAVDGADNRRCSHFDGLIQVHSV
jgi:hypothetical protein